MQLQDYKDKVEIIRRYRAAKDKRAEFTEAVNAPSHVELSIDGELYTFTLSGNEMAWLLSDFANITSIHDLFSRSGNS